jgi:hypothetical protein
MANQSSVRSPSLLTYKVRRYTEPVPGGVDVVSMRGCYSRSGARRGETADVQRHWRRCVVDHKCHEDVSPALGPVESILPVQLHQSALWAAHIQRLFDGYVERSRNTFASSPDRGDGLTMQVRKTFVNSFVVKYFMNYIFCSFDTGKAFRDYKVTEFGAFGAFGFFWGVPVSWRDLIVWLTLMGSG